MSRNRAVLTAAALTALLTVFPATGSQAADAPSAGERIANELRDEPVYVDRAYADAVPPSRQRELTQQIKETGLPIKVVLTPLTKGDPFNGDADTLASVLHDRLPQRELILITTDGVFTDSLNGYEWPADTHQTRDAVAATGFLDEMRDAGLADLTSKAVELVAEGNGTEVYEEATEDLGEQRDQPKPAEKPEGSAWPQVAAAIGLALAVLTTAALVAYRRRHRRRTPAMTPALGAARAAEEAEVRHRAEAEVVALGEAVRTADAATTPDLSRALDAYAAAGKVLDEARDLTDLAGALALAAEGRAALAPHPSLPLCYFNPLHGQATTRTTWRRLGHRESVTVATCPTCTTTLATHRTPDSLTELTEDGRLIPYYEGQSIWAATGYGSLPGDGMASRVARGEFTRGVADGGRQAST
ncbi:hypothetical protein Stsp02_66060 [Streptomyces sp. NBRC 14336]|uniref:hypothetical protein n=1 Tax=Streptomyces sp. NBRC 14336 TaxID=3030992 RepID=UPI0024A191D3|nr:hypothetical protein [Streptomyces sp. NBRC 14336]WBO79684.1 hypothetical protein SBE_003400 [Streptomyces sp. SBE_14.2]GLW50945.1 hypothetical protein Stsp02_66060 [Streptomyces sp. NBRC 14336]